MKVQRRIEEIAKKSAGSVMRRGYLADDYDGIGSVALVKLSQGSSSGILASVAAGAFGTEQITPAGTPVMLMEYRGHLEVISLGSKLGAQAISTEMISQELSIEDPTISAGEEYTAAPVITPGGFGGTWSELIADGVYNSRFASSTPGTLEDGQTPNLPYWSVRRRGSATLEVVQETNWPSGKYVKMMFATSDDSATIMSNMVPVTGGFEYSLAVHYDTNAGSTSTTILIEGTIDWYDSAGVRISPNSLPIQEYQTAGPFDNFVGDVHPVALSDGLSSRAPNHAAYAVVSITGMHWVGFDATTWIGIGAVDFRKSAYALDQDADIHVNSVLTSSLYSDGSAVQLGAVILDYVSHTRSSSVTNWDPAADFVSLILVENTAGANINIHSLVMANTPIPQGRMMKIMNLGTSTAETITLIHASATALDPAMTFRCPANTDYAIPARGGVTLIYAGSLWRVMP